MSNTNQKSPLKESIERGNEIYTDFCVSCHLPNGQGVRKTYPPLANSDYLIKKQEASIKAIKYGLSGSILVNGETYNNVMTPMGLDDQEIADVMNYINNSWGNKNDKMVTKLQVSKVKK
ncbi:cytochrome C [Siansivirga zeaxanthinifaciens CC-SAMT-1]|uniref:Cytochrome C n=1 Tax=Siansivirga zeaxanthinifaciens CC-SAMT-1 TaxID=1454006 RepID=A0A0C5VX78_9FLAO|nr:cytochrome C [Siansivirga zeaxanthinifaciens CC-SAMT-1]